MGDRTRGTVQSNDEQAWRRGRVGSLLATLRELDLPQLVDPREEIPGIPVVTKEVR